MINIHNNPCDSQSRRVFLVMNNTDRTEGRGAEYVSAVCEVESTARRIAKGGYIQGLDCPVIEKGMIFLNGEWVISFKYVPITLPTFEDLAEEDRLAKLKIRHQIREEILEKAKALGLTLEEIKIIMDIQ